MIRHGLSQQLRIAVRRIKPASFNPPHNQTRAMVLLALDDYREHHSGRGKGLTVKELLAMTGRPYGSIAASVGKWMKWDFISRHCASDSNGRLIFHYRIAPRGRRWLQKHLPYMPLDQYLADLQKQGIPKQQGT